MKFFSSRLHRAVALFLVVYLSMLYVAPAAAGLVASRVSGATTIDSRRSADLVIAQRVLENRVVAQKLKDYGVSSDDVKARLNGMSDQDLHTLASASAGLPSGGDGADAVIEILIIVLLVIVILKLMNKRVVVK